MCAERQTQNIFWHIKPTTQSSVRKKVTFLVEHDIVMSPRNVGATFASKRTENMRGNIVITRSLKRVILEMHEQILEEIHKRSGNRAEYMVSTKYLLDRVEQDGLENWDELLLPQIRDDLENSGWGEAVSAHVIETLYPKIYFHNATVTEGYERRRGEDEPVILVNGHPYGWTEDIQWAVDSICNEWGKVLWEDESTAYILEPEDYEPRGKIND